MQGSEVMVAGVQDAAGEAGMLFTPMLGGLAGLAPAIGLAGTGAGAAVLVAGAVGGGGDEDPLAVSITSGTQSVGHIVNGADYADGIEIGGTGTPGASGVITVGDVSQNVVVDGNGNWEVSFDSGQLPGGEYQSVVEVTLAAGGETVTDMDVLVVDTVADVDVAADIVEGDGMVNFEEESDGVTLTGTSQPGSTVVVTVGGADYDAQVDGNGGWAVDIDSGTLQQGEYDLDVTMTATDTNGNSATTSDTIHIDTVTSLTLGTSGVGGADGNY